jgi:hypothetical protein
MMIKKQCYHSQWLAKHKKKSELLERVLPTEHYDHL